MAAPNTPEDLVRNGAVDQRDAEQVALGPLVALADRLGHLVGLAEAGADVTVLVADHHQGREREPPAALHDLGDAVDVDDAVDELADFVR